MVERNKVSISADTSPGEKLRTSPMGLTKMTEKLRVESSEEQQEENAGEQALRSGSDATGKMASKVRNEYYSKKVREQSYTGNDTKGGGAAKEGSHAQSKKLHKERLAKSGANAGKSGAKSVGTKAAEESRKALQKVAQAVAENPGGAVIALVVVLLLLVVVAVAGVGGLIAPGGGNAMLGASYTAKDTEILDTDAKYSEFEQQVKSKAYQAITDYPDYNEYCFDLDEVGHDPHVLASYLTVVYEDYTRSQVAAHLYGLLQGQYELTYTGRTEIRTRMVTKTRWETRTRWEEKTKHRLVWDAEAKKFVIESYQVMEEESYRVQVTYQEEEEYEYYILDVKLENRGLNSVVEALMNTEQKDRYEVLLSTKGNKGYLFGSN